MRRQSLRKHLIEQILTVDAADTESTVLHCQAFDTLVSRAIASDDGDIEAIAEKAAKAKTSTLIGFLERKALIKQTLEEI